MKNILKIFTLYLLALVLVGCAAKAAPTLTPTPSPTETPAPSPSFTPAPTETPTPEPSPTFTPLPTATNTLVPFPGFSRVFEFNKAWIADNKTHFYFLNSQVDMKLYDGRRRVPIHLQPRPKVSKSHGVPVRLYGLEKVLG